MSKINHINSESIEFEEEIVEWIPDVGDVFYVPDITGLTKPLKEVYGSRHIKWTACPADFRLLSMGLVYQTQEKALEKQALLSALINLLNR